FAVQSGFLFTAGASNPHYSAGTNIQYGVRGCRSVAATSVNETVCPSDMCPVVCYPGDTLAWQVWVSSTATLDKDSNTSAVQSRFVPNYTGRWLRTGT